MMEARQGEHPSSAVDDPVAALVRHLDGGGTVRQLYRLDAVSLEVLYAYGCQRYRDSDFEQARQIFFALAALDTESFDYWLSLGMSLQKLHRHDEASYCFSRTAVMRMMDPRSSYLAGLSLQLSGDVASAREAYTTAIKLCGRQPRYRELREQAMQSLAGLANSKKGGNSDGISRSE